MRLLFFMTILFLPALALAGIRVYNPETGGDVEIQEGQTLPQKEESQPAVRIQPGKPQIAAPTKKATPQDPQTVRRVKPLLIEPESVILGRAQIFIEPSKFSKNMADRIMQVVNTEGLQTELYSREADVKDVMGMLMRGMKDMDPGVRFKEDSGNRRAHHLGIRQYMVVHYTSPFGDQEIFPLVRVGTFLRRLEDIKEQVVGIAP